MGNPAKYFESGDRILCLMDDTEGTVIGGPWFVVGSTYTFYATRYDDCSEPVITPVLHEGNVIQGNASYEKVG